MRKILAEYVDQYGNEYELLGSPDDVDDDDDDLRNARRVPAPRTAGSTDHRARPVQKRPRPTRPSAPRTPAPDPAETVTIKTRKVLQFVEVATDGMADLIPLPEPPPSPTGDTRTDMQNQNEHRHALHSHRVLTNRIRTGGRVLSRVFELLLD